LAEWRKLPAAERQPGGLLIPEQRHHDKIVAQAPPGGLILKVHQSALHRNKQGELRRQAYHYPETYGTRLKYEPGHDYVWLTAAEWQALLPAAPRKGDTFALPAALAEQFTFMLRDTSRLGTSDPSVTWKPGDVRVNELKVTVDDVGPILRLRLDGRVQLRETVKVAGKGAARFDGHLLGYLHYNLEKKAFVRFEVLALGEFQGWQWPAGPNGITSSVRQLTPPYMLGVSFALREVSLATPSNWHGRGK
jgi:hypothetical protein